MAFGVNIAHMVQHPRRLADVPVAICNEAAAIAKDAFVTASGAWSLLSHSFTDGSTWPDVSVWRWTSIVQMASTAHRSLIDPTERAYAAMSTDYTKEARRVMDALRSTRDVDADRFIDPLASGWDDVVRRPSLLAPAISPLPDVSWADETDARPASSASA